MSPGTQASQGSKKRSNPSSQPRLSVFFKAPSSSSHIDLTLSDEEPPTKKPRTGIEPVSKVDQWRFNSSQPGPSSSMNTAEKSPTNTRREEFKRVLLSQNSVFDFRPPDEEESPERMEEDADPAQEDGNESADSDEAFKQLTDLFSNKSGKAKGKSKKVAGSSKSKKKAEEIGPSGQAYTPSEKQIIQLIQANPDTVLMIEVGYKFYFHEESAKIASKELGIVAYVRRNLLTASIPVHRRDVHLKKLLSQGHKVGIVEQTETAALKKISETRNTLFERKLTHLYTATTYVDELDSVDDLEKHVVSPLICLTETSKQSDGPGESVSISMIAISPSTGDVIWDEFDDSIMRTELETRLVHTRPAEVLLPDQGLSKMTEKVLEHFVQSTTKYCKIRTERFSDIMTYTDAFELVSDFYATNTKANEIEADSNAKPLAIVADFPQQVVVALAHAIKYLSAFSIADAFLGAKFFTKFTNKTHMLLNGNTLTNLELFRNDTDYQSKGSLMWILDHTRTKFGARLLKSWIARPLTDKRILQDRIDAVEEIISSPSEKLVALRQLMKKMPDLAKGLSRIQYGKCTPQELGVILSAFNKIAHTFDNYSGGTDSFNSNLLNEVMRTFPTIKSPIRELLNRISLNRAAEGKKESLWTNPDDCPALGELHILIQTVEVELEEELKSIRKLIKKPSLQWTSVPGTEYLIELKKSENRTVPDNWEIVSRSKYLTRYMTPRVKLKVEERARYKEALASEANKTYAAFLDDIAQNHYSIMRDTVNKLATVDCLLSFAHVALQEGYVRPEFTDDDTLEISEGRHPMVEALRTDPFVANSICMGGNVPRSAIITGPNMGGKSSAVRMVALIAIMAQIGSYVPAKSVKLGILDSILTRMGASDELARGRSTFMVEMTETCDILQAATDRSLVILDELGRGTSTADGMAIAGGVLQHLVQEVQCKTLFITHYPLVAIDLEKRFVGDIRNLHMGYTTETRIDGTRNVTFLYHLTPGIAAESFGIECARLAGVPEQILEHAFRRAKSCQVTFETHSIWNKINKCARLINQSLSRSDKTNESTQDLRSLVSSK
ncbi:muts domain V-domain-containing protein [Hygrophoropsis aurantiaca]|uniref:Muts domain V-domain-containing protein n=1 Tax=Hygrophoropsis aurantiaca TaxID=72124 RepID=A0ACB8ABM2_9AGAM|nr:muts domain V-domain-containing protein [Hygrophoropsis aurantiaca]